jgi:hypothetical protein
LPPHRDPRPRPRHTWTTFANPVPSPGLFEVLIEHKKRPNRSGLSVALRRNRLGAQLSAQSFNRDETNAEEDSRQTTVGHCCNVRAKKE